MRNERIAFDQDFYWCRRTDLPRIRLAARPLVTGLTLLGLGRKVLALSLYGSLPSVAISASPETIA
jgi:hypothetical protein